MTPNLPLEVFIVEDNLDAAENLRDILELDEHRVTIAFTAAAAFSSPAIASAEVILLDWKLPDASALEVLPRLAELAPHADVIVITGFGDFERAVSALREGAADYLLKPVNPESLQASIRRLAQRRWLTRQKTRSEENFRHLVEAAPCLILIVRRDLTAVYFSPYGTRVTGYETRDVEGHNFKGTPLGGHPPDRIERAIEAVFELGEVAGFESQFVELCGTLRWLTWNARVLNDFDGAPAVLAVAQDVTEQKLSTERMVQSERLAAIGEAMTGLAHESRNALQRSQAFLELLAVQVEGQAESLELVSQIQKAQNHLHQLYEEVRQYAAPLRPNRELVDLEDLVAETWTNLEHQRRGRDANLDYSSSGVLSIRADPFMLQQVFRNIFENSLAACPDPVRISARLSLEWQGRSAMARISIRDNGPGLTSEQRARIFEPFFTTKTRGTGLGMTLAKRIVDAHAGRIRMGDGPGAEVVIELPAETSA